MIKDDVLGVGAKKKSEDHECTGLDGFQDLLGRLNGKDEGEVERGRKAREKNKREIIVGERYRMRFVLGEVYQSSDIEQLLRKQRGEGAEEQGEVKTEVKEEVGFKVREGDGPAMKLEGLKVEVAEVGEEGMRKKTKSRKRKIKEEDEDEGQGKRRKKRDKKEEKGMKNKKGKEYRREKKKDTESEISGITTPLDESKDLVLSISKSKRKKEAKESSKDHKEKGKEKGKEKEKKEKRGKEGNKDKTDKEEEVEVAAVAAVTAAAVRALTGRRAIRHKYIAAKRSAVMDGQALNEVWASFSCSKYKVYTKDFLLQIFMIRT